MGLGNPGSQYDGTRHNAGFMLLDELAWRWRLDWRVEKRFNSQVTRLDEDDGVCWLCKPQTFMNLSGEAVGAMAAWYRIPPEKVLVCCDDADLGLGWVRLRASGSPGGHHGLESVEKKLGSRNYPRLKLGIGRRNQTGPRDIAGHVLGKFSRDEMEVWDQVVARAADQAACWLLEGPEAAANKYNGQVPDLSGNN